MCIRDRSATYAANATDYASGYRGDFVNDDAMCTNMRGSIIEGYKASLPATALVQNIATEDGVSATIKIAPKFYGARLFLRRNRHIRPI